MLVYLLLAVSPLLISLLVGGYYQTNVDDNPRAKRTFLFWCGLILFLVTALRHNSLGSVDSGNYYNHWIRTCQMPWEELLLTLEVSDFEPGYNITVWVLSRIFPDPQFLFVLTGILFSTSVCRAVYKNSEDSVLSMIMYISLGLYTFMLQGLRQAVAISICLFALEFCKKRKAIPFAFLMLLAFLFHRTSIIFSIVYFVYGLKFDHKTKLIMPGVAALLFLLSPTLVRYGNEFLDRDYGAVETSGAVIATAIYFIIIAVAYIFLNEDNCDENTTFFVFITVIGTAFYLSRFAGMQIMDRISFYFMIGQIMVLPTVIRLFDSRSRYLIKFSVCVLCILLFMYRLNTSFSTEYMFFWE